MKTRETISAENFDCKARLTELQSGFASLEFDFSKPQSKLYNHLGKVYRLILDIGRDTDRIKSLKQSIEVDTITDRQRKLATSVTRRVCLYVFSRDSKSVINKSTRSLYTRALERAVEGNMTEEQFISALESVGVFSFANVKDSCNATPKVNKAKLIEDRLDLLSVERIPSLQEIDAIDGKNPNDGFALVLYCAKDGSLVPCASLDSPIAINAFVWNLIRSEKFTLQSVDVDAESIRKAA